MNRPWEVSERWAKAGAWIWIAWLAAGAAGAADAAKKPRVIVDFEEAQAVRLSPSQAQATRASSAGSRVLQITTEAQSQYPSVTLEPRQGAWDLSGFDGVEMDVRNLDDVPVRVLLSLNNPGADGQNHCNTESVTVSERGRAVLVVPFGMWHGSSGHPLDLKNIVSMSVLLDRPGRGHRFEIDNIRAVAAERINREQLLADPFLQQLQPVLGRGVNFGNALDAPQEGEWGVTLKESYFEQIQRAGFDAVRIPVRWSAHAETSPPYRIDPKFLERVDWALRQALQRRLHVVLNMHHYNEIFEQPDAHRARFLALWKQIAEHYRSQPPALFFELLNEPNSKLTADKWNKLLLEALAVVRISNPQREVVVGPVGWNGIGELKSLVLPEEDRHLTVTVHYYNPFQFTHQGADWTGPQAQQWLGTSWNGTPAERQAVEQDLDLALAWGVKHRRPIYLGEFGAFSKADMASRARWTRFVADAALQRKMSFAYWEFCSGFGIYDPTGERWIEPLKDALLPPDRK